MRSVTLRGGGTMPGLGLGTWRMGESSRHRTDEMAALRAGLDAGIGLIDTAEMYGEGGAEEVVRDAVAGRRDEVFIVSKVYPHNASRAGTIAACERSLKRLGTDRIDLYLLHWRGSEPLSETVAGFESLVASGKIRRWGVSNFDVDDMAELEAMDQGGRCATNQVLYHPGERGIEWRLLPDAVKAGMPLMAYSPLGQGAILMDGTVIEVARRHGAPPAAVAIAWSLLHPNLISIPKTARTQRIADIVAGGRLKLAAADLSDLDRAFPPPRRREPLAML